ncbi:MAG: autotransporter-associated beta strand repeat-containing protein [Verrucomicrobia bacterium]|nr:autotransporter-associated beta strand repeat-containing protein [Verrucomicrobiota bacterium]
MKTLTKTSNLRSSSMRFLAALVAVFACAASPARAQTFFHVGGENVIGSTTLATVAEGPKRVATVPRGGVHWTAAGGEGVVYSKLKSPTLTVPNTGLVTLKFTHRYNFEQLWDGGAVYVSVNGAESTYVDASAFAAHGYDGLLTFPGWVSSVFVGQQVFTGQSADFGTPALIESVVNLGTLSAGDTLAIEFRGGWDEGYVEAAPNWEIGTVEVRDAANTAMLNVDFLNGPAGFTAVNDAGLTGPWSYLGPQSQFEINGDTLAADRYVPDSPGPNTIIDLNGADLAVVLLAGTLEPGDAFTLFDLSGGTTVRGNYNSLALPAGTWNLAELGVTGKIVRTGLIPASTAKDMLTVVFPGLPAALIAGTDISLTVPYWTKVSALAPTYTVSPLATGSPPSGTVRDFTSPQAYTVTAQDGTTKVYTVTVNVAPPIEMNGLALWLDASQLSGVPAGQQVNTWTDRSGQNNHAIRQGGSSAGYPKYLASELNGRPVVRFNSSNGNPGDYFRFNRISTIRSVFWVLKENASLTDFHFLLGDDTAFDFHRGSANGPLWTGYTSPFIRSGTTKLMGTVINGATTALPANAFQVISLVTTGDVQANQVTQDRIYHGSWEGDIAEILIYTRALSTAEEGAVGSYLADKYGLTTAYEPATPQARILTFGLPGNPAVIDHPAMTIAWTVPYGTDVATLAPTFTTSHGASCDHVSGTPYDFTSPVPYTVTASDATTRVYQVTVTVAPMSPAKDILTFGPGGVITANNIAWSVPFGTDLTSLAPTYTVSPFAKGDPVAGTVRDFTTPQTYTITAQNGSTRDYTVTVTILPNPSLALIGHWVSGAPTLSDSSGFTPAGTHDGVAEGPNAAWLAYSSEVPAGFTGTSLDLTAGGAGNVGVTINNSKASDTKYMNTFDDPILAKFTISFWAKGFPNGGWWSPWVSKHGEGSEGWQVRRAWDTSNPTFTIRGTGNDDPPTAIDTNDTSWHHYAGVFDGVAGTRKLYVDGVDYLGLSGLFGTVGNPRNYRLELGARDGGDFFKGLLFDVRIYSIALESSEVQVVMTTPALPAPRADILSFGLPGNPAVIDQAAKTIAWTVPHGTNVTSLAPTYTVSPSAAGTPPSGAVRNFTTPQTYTITAQDSLTTKVYTVTVLVTPTWLRDGSGLWSTTTNWDGGRVANGTGVTADFNSIDITADRAVSLDSPRTIGKLIFGDTAPASAAGWILSNNGAPVNILTLAGGAPTITVNALGTGKDATISAQLAGTSGLIKSGAGTLTLTNTNTYTGDTVIEAGVLRVGGTSGSVGPGNVANDATLAFNNTGAVTLANRITGYGSLRQEGPGTVSLTGENTCTGLTTVSAGTLVLSGNNAAATGGITVSGGVAQFNALASINGSGRNVLVNSGGTVVFGPSLGVVNLPAALSRIVSASAGAIAANNFSAVNLSFSAAGLTGASLGALGNVTYTGTLTPNGTTYRLGGGGGTLTLTKPLSGVGRAVLVNGNVILQAANTHTGSTTVTGGTLTLADNAALTFVVTNALNNRLTGTGSATLNGDFTIDTTAVTATAGAWTLVNVAGLTASFGATFSILGTGWSELAKVWTKTDGTKVWTFTESTGILTLSVLGNRPPAFPGYAVSGKSDQPLAIHPAKLLARASDPDGDAVSLARVISPSAHGGTVALTSTVNYTPPAGYAGTDTFEVELTDARGATVRGTITITLTAAPIGPDALARNLTDFSMHDGQAKMVFRGIPGRSYIIQRSPDMTHWNDLATVTAGPDGKVSFTDPAPPVPSGYYRTRSN